MAEWWHDDDDYRNFHVFIRKPLLIFDLHERSEREGKKRDLIARGNFISGAFEGIFIFLEKKSKLLT